MSTFSEMALQMHRTIWYPVHVALGLEQPGMILPEEFAPSLSDPLGNHRRKEQQKRRRIARIG